MLMIKGKYKQLCLFSQIGGIDTIVFTQPLPAIKTVIRNLGDRNK